MWCWFKLVIISTVCVPLVYSDAVIVTITKQDKFYCLKPYTFKCEVTGAACCTGTRDWRKETVPIMSNGAELTTSGKYSESVSHAENYFTLTINNINDDDFSKDFVCSYSFFTSNTTRLSKDDFECEPCWKCVQECFLYTLAIGFPVGLFLVIMIIIIILFGFCCCCKSGCHKYFKIESNKNPGSAICEFLKQAKIQKTLGISCLVTAGVYILIYGTIPSLTFGWFCHICYYSRTAYLIIFALEFLTFSAIFHWTYKFQSDDSISWINYILYLIATFLIVTIWIPFVHRWYCRKYHACGNNRSKESGSSCWPPCSVGPDPNSPDPENARSLLKKNADKKNEKKPVAVVRSQPPKNRHVKTDNTESTRYSAETEIFDEGVHKSAKPRPLPSIGQPTNSPRPLPQMPPSSQLEKGGIQLEPLGDSTSEKKKKKRRKKKESKQSGDED